LVHDASTKDASTKDASTKHGVNGRGSAEFALNPPPDPTLPRLARLR
jgi:hypothetical protein